MYERSFMHRDLVTHISVAKSAEFIITGSCDGHVKFWKKMPDNIEFVKHFQAHLGTISYQHDSFSELWLQHFFACCCMKVGILNVYDPTNRTIEKVGHQKVFSTPHVLEKTVLCLFPSVPDILFAFISFCLYTSIFYEICIFFCLYVSLFLIFIPLFYFFLYLYNFDYF